MKNIIKTTAGGFEKTLLTNHLDNNITLTLPIKKPKIPVTSSKKQTPHSHFAGGPQRPKRPRPGNENGRNEAEHPQGGNGQSQSGSADRSPPRRRCERG